MISKQVGAIGSSQSPRPPSTGDKCVVKTHYPLLEVKNDKTAKPSRLLVLVRNPVDTVLSSFRYYIGKDPNVATGTMSLAAMAAKYMCVTTLDSDVNGWAVPRPGWTPAWRSRVCAVCDIVRE